MLQGNGAVSVGFEERGSSYRLHENSKAGKLELNWIPAPRVYHTSNFRDAAMRTHTAGLCRAQVCLGLPRPGRRHGLRLARTGIHIS